MNRTLISSRNGIDSRLLAMLISFGRTEIYSGRWHVWSQKLGKNDSEQLMSRIAAVKRAMSLISMFIEGIGSCFHKNPGSPASHDSCS